MTEGRQLGSASLFLTVLGAMAFTPPLVLVFNVPVRLFGIPAEVVYLFLVWAGLCLGTAVLARKLPQDVSDEDRSKG